MQLIALKNFKSYENQVINNLSPHINLIIGKNGQGKSNFFKAIIFALTDRIPLNKTEYNSHLHKALDNTAQPIAVELYVRSKLNQRQYDQNIYKLERIWQNEGSQDLRVDQKVFSKGEYEAFVQSLGFSYSNSYNIIQQGKINQIILMDQFDIYRLLEEATGMKKYEKRHQEAVGFMNKNEEQKSEIKNTLKEIQTRLQVYQSRREEFQYYNFQEKANKFRNKAQYESSIDKYRKQTTALKQKQANSSDEITKMKIKVKDMQIQLQQINGEISVNQKQMYEHFDESTMDDELNMSVNLSQDERQYASQLKKIKTSKDKLKRQLQKVSSQVQKIKQEMKPYKEKYQFLNSQMQAQKMSKLGKQKGKEQLKGWIKKTKQNIQQIQSQLKKVQKMKTQYKISPGTIQLNQIQSKKQKLGQVMNQLKANKIKYFQSSRLKNQYESQAEVLSQQIQVTYSKMRKILPLLQFNLLNELRKQKVKGVYGFLVEFVDILPTVLFAYQMSGSNKLCTLLVQNQQTCQIVVNMVKKLKGKQVNILPLSFIKKQPNIKKTIPSIEDCYSLLNQQWIKIKSHQYGQQFSKNIQKIIVNTFSSHVLVKDYDLGLKVSKQYHLNCITADKQIVYSQGYLCKVGKDISVDDKFETYIKYSQKSSQLEQTSKKLAQAVKEVMMLQNGQMDLMRKRATLQSQIRNLQLKLEVINEQKRSLGRLQDQQQKLAQKKAKFQQQIARKQEILTNFDKRAQTKINMKQFKELQQLYNNRLRAYNQKSEAQSELQNKVATVLKEQQTLSEQMKDVSRQISFQKQFNVSFIGGKQFKQRLQSTNQQLQNKRKKLQSQLLKISQHLSQKQNQNYNYLGTIGLLEDQIRFYTDQLEDLGSLDITIEEIEERSNSFSMSMSKMDQRKKVRIYTTLQKLMFSKIDGYLQKHKQAISKLKDLELYEKQINDMIARFQVDKDRCVNNVFLNFEKNFDSIFKAVTLHGKTDVRLKKINDKSRGFLKIKNSISIMVSFEGEREVTKKWSQFSGGQKTVIAVCLLMALQRCQPAPFYILDQIDSALDSVYLERIVRMIQQQSLNSQYFITSFKTEMLEFSEERCNYYLVENVDRISTIKRISQEYAKQVIDGIVVN